MFTEDQLVPISALQHYMFCPRQCALIHVEQVWAENRLTVEGRQMHERAHEKPGELREGVWIARGVSLHSHRLGLTGIADVVEFHPIAEGGVRLPGRRGNWLPSPVEYKRGRPKADDCDRVQLCAQALCLEEMLELTVERGALFYGRQRRRQDVVLDDALRDITERVVEQVHELLAAGATPAPSRGEKCGQCSLSGACHPAAASRKSVAHYMAEALE